MHRLAIVPLILLALPLQELRAGPGEVPASTLLEAGPLREAQLVVLAQVEEVHDVLISSGGYGQQIVFFLIEQTYTGAAVPGERIAVRVVGHRPTLDPARPSVPYFQEDVEGRFVLFLGRAPDGHAYVLQDLYGARGRDGEGKILAVAAAARLSRILEPVIKGQETLAWLTRALEGDNVWLTQQAARELHHLLTVLPRAFDVAARARLNSAMAGVRDGDARWWLARLSQRLQEVDPPASVDRALDSWQRSFLGLATPEERRAAATTLIEPSNDSLTRLGWVWDQSEPSLRIALLEATVTRQRADLLGEWKLRYGNEEDLAVREQILRAVGLIGGGDQAPWLIERSRNPALARPAMLALARLRTSGAKARLLEVAEQLEAAPDLQGAITASWVRWLLTTAFEEAEAAAGRPLRPQVPEDSGRR